MDTNRISQRTRPSRRAVTLVFTMVMTVVLAGMIAMAVDVGYIVLTRTQLQVAADAAAMAGAAHMGQSREAVVAAARQYAAYHSAAGKAVEIADSDVEFGTWDSSTRVFTPGATVGNAVRVTARRDAAHGGAPGLFFGRAMASFDFTSQASAVAMANPRDIAFVVDLSGSMNDDTEPCWATGEINKTFSPQGYGSIGSALVQQLYDDLGYGPFPGKVEWVGEPWGVAPDKYAYAELTKNSGPLAYGHPDKYRIQGSDSEAVRKQKAYSAIIDLQLARLMPNARPPLDSSTHYAYWEKYLDYILEPITIVPPKSGGSKSGGSKSGGSKSGSGSGGGGGAPSGPQPPIGWIGPEPASPWYAAWMADPRHRVRRTPSPSLFAMAPGPAEQALLGQVLAAPTHVSASGPGTPPNDRGTVPPGQDADRITRFNNPNRSTFPQSKTSVPKAFRNQLGYVTYVQFMLDHGRDLKPDGSTYVPVSPHSPYCPYHSEDTAGGTFRFPPRTQPVHAARRALIAAIQVVKERNAPLDPNQGDWVSIVTFDTLAGGGPVIRQSLTCDYDAAMQACTALEAVGDKSATTATEAGLIAARQHVRPKNEGGEGRLNTNKVVVLLTDGVPNLYVTGASEIDAFVSDNSKSEFYSNGAYWCDAALMQSLQMQMKRWAVFPVGIGLGTDYDFMDRMSRLGGTADDDGQSPRGSGNPAEYEQRLTEIFKKIITNPQVRLVQ